MLASYIRIAIAQLLRHRLYGAINIIGLAIGLAACLLIVLYVQHETSYEKQWPDAERIYRVNFAAALPGSGLTRFTEIPFVAMPALQRYFADEIEAATRVIWRSGELRQDQIVFNQTLYRADRSFDDIFTFVAEQGSLATVLAAPGRIALRQDVALRLFGNEDAMGRIVTMQYPDGAVDLTVGAVYTVPGNTIMNLPTLTHLDETTLPEDYFSWTSLTSDSYFKVRQDVDIDAMRARIADFTDRNVDVSDFFPDPGLVTSETVFYSFQAMTDIYLNSPWDTFRRLGSKTQVHAFSAIAVLVLLIGSINFTILSTAKATRRVREVAMRKAIGAHRRQLVLQFLGESLLLVLLAMMLAMVLVECLLPLFESFTNRQLDVDWRSWPFLGAALALWWIVGILGGLYPAFVLSGSCPGRSVGAGAAGDVGHVRTLRNILVIFQFSTGIALVVATAVIWLQVSFGSSRDPGFESSGLLVINDIDRRRELYPRMDVLREEILRVAGVENAAFSTWQPSQRNQGFGSYDLLGEGGVNYTIARTGVGHDFFRTYRMPILAGRDFSRELDMLDPIFNLDPDIDEGTFTAPRNVLVNWSAVRQLGFSTPEGAIGRVLRTVNPEDGARNYTIVGVVADSHFYSLNAEPRAEVFHLTPNRPNVLTIRLSGDPRELLARIEQAWHEVMGDARLSLAFVDQLLAAEFTQERIEARMLLSFSVLAIVVACLGLYGTAVLAVEKRVKEIGIRKVLGAEVKELLGMLLWQFSRPVLVANAIAWPVAMWAMLRWLQGFPYQIDAIWLVPLCVAAGALVLCIAWVVVAGTAYRAASARPVLALRYE